jgi:hypothetical protein
MYICEIDENPLNKNNINKYLTYKVTYNGEAVSSEVAETGSQERTLLLAKSKQPMYDACRELQKLGMKGKVGFCRAGHKVDMVMDVDKGAKCAIKENDKHGPVVVPFQPMSEEQKKRVRIAA